MTNLQSVLSIDTPVFVSAFGSPDEFTNASRNFFSLLSTTHQILLSTVILAEVVVVLYRQNPYSSHKAFTYLQQFTAIVVDQDLLIQCMNYLSHNTLKASDFLIATTAALHHATLITWDKQLLSSANAICKTITPKQFIETRDS